MTRPPSPMSTLPSQSHSSICHNNNHNQNPKNNNVRNKTVYFIRHAESLENCKHKSAHRVLQDLYAASLPDLQDVRNVVELLDLPAQVDTPVSPRGQEQIRNVAAQLAQTDFVQQAGIRLVVHSPLQRAQETAQGLLSCRAGASTPLTVSNTQTLSSQQEPKQGPIKILQQHPSVERVVQLESLRERTPDEIWIPWRKWQYTQRRLEFLTWLAAQPETMVAVVGHSEYFKALLGLPFKFNHCDVWKAEYRPYGSGTGSGTGTGGSGTNGVYKKWFGLELLYRSTIPKEYNMIENKEHKQVVDKDDTDDEDVSEEES